MAEIAAPELSNAPDSDIIKKEMIALARSGAAEGLLEVQENFQRKGLPSELHIEVIAPHAKDIVSEIEPLDIQGVEQKIHAFEPKEQLVGRDDKTKIKYRLLFNARPVPRIGTVIKGKTEAGKLRIQERRMSPDMKAHQRGTQYDAVAITAEIGEDGEVQVVIGSETATAYTMATGSSPFIGVLKQGTSEQRFTQKGWENRERFGDTIAVAAQQAGRSNG